LYEINQTGRINILPVFFSASMKKPVYLMYTGPGREDENGIVTKDPDEPMMSEKISMRKKAK
jgi:hypothetical protein